MRWLDRRLRLKPVGDRNSSADENAADRVALRVLEYVKDDERCDNLQQPLKIAQL
jgi:hypothetical protein